MLILIFITQLIDQNIWKPTNRTIIPILIIDVTFLIIILSNMKFFVNQSASRFAQNLLVNFYRLQPRASIANFVDSPHLHAPLSLSLSYIYFSTWLTTLACSATIYFFLNIKITIFPILSPKKSKLAGVLRYWSLHSFSLSYSYKTYQKIVILLFLVR